jgi:hypothetical protein
MAGHCIIERMSLITEGVEVNGASLVINEDKKVKTMRPDPKIGRLYVKTRDHSFVVITLRF